MSSSTAVSAAPADYTPATAFVNAIRAGFRIAQESHCWAVERHEQVLGAWTSKVEAVRGAIQLHAEERALQLHYAASTLKDTAPAVSESLTLLARKVEGSAPSLAEILADEPATVTMTTSDAIIALAETPSASLSEFTAIELHDAAQAAQAQRDAVAKTDFHAMMRWAKIAQRLHQEVDRRGRAIAPRSYPTYAEDYNTTRRRRRGGRW